MSAFVRSIRAPIQAAARRQYTSSASSSQGASAPVVGHSSKRVAVVAGVSAIAGVDVTYAYFTYVKAK
ncbi:hypothetical protein BGW38_005550 [Lunasporangiospora selenospora]|uniref:Uncharacterized protein n=1 Tax=Lunasporangiospora selenospora TaxID=979761 RepID=A0A9P6G1K5_9FUNG|nr:hypothetical protein BGW38_005550 [Lunasporangiospora selenospora]